MLNNLLPTITTRLSAAVRLATLSGAVLIGLGIGGYRLAIPEPKVISPTAPALGVAQVSNTKPVVIVFNHPVNPATLRHAIHPALKGTWSLKTNLISAKSTLTFTPSESPDLGTRYTIELTGIQSRVGGHPKNYLLSFQTDSLPTLALISPANTTAEVAPDAPIVATFDKPLSDSVAMTASLTPELTLNAVKISGKSATFTHTSQFQKGTTYTLKVLMATVKRNYTAKTTTVSSEAKEISSTTFSTIAAPGIDTYAPIGAGVDAAAAIQLTFKQAMDHDSTQAAFAFAPAATGAFSWTNSQTMVFTPTQPLTKDQTYTVTLTKTAKAIGGFALDEDFTFSFTTLGPVKVSAWSPGDGATGVDTGTTVSLTFNQDVVHASAESKFSLAPAVNGSFSWSGNVMTFTPSAALAASQAYTATEGAGVETIKGTPSIGNFSAKFTTRSQSVMFNVPAYRQAHMYTCMIAAARSAMAYRNVFVSEASIIARVGRDTTAWSGTWGGSNGVWGDPDAAMVGGLDNAEARGKLGSTKVNWGYGSHWGPISKMLTSYGIGNDVHTGMTVQQLAQSITDNNPVIIWWVNGIWPSYEVKWKTPSGKTVRGVNGLHVQVVRGFTGSVDNPTSFTVTDSGYGFPGRTFDIGTFKAKWNWFGNTGIIVK